MEALNELLAATARIDTRWLLVFLLVVLDTWSVGLILRSSDSRRDRFLWSGIVLLCPIIGCLFWYVLGPKPELWVSRGRGAGR